MDCQREHILLVIFPCKPRDTDWRQSGAVGGTLGGKADAQILISAAPARWLLVLGIPLPSRSHFPHLQNEVEAWMFFGFVPQSSMML